MTRLTCSTALVLALCLVASNGRTPTFGAVAVAAIDPHAYFDAMVARNDYWKSYSLRDPAQLQTRANGGYSACNSCPIIVTYDPANDPDPRRQDAAKIVIPTTTNNLLNQLHLPLGTTDGRTYLITWDSWMGAEHRASTSGLATWKHFQLQGNRSTGTAGIWFETRTRFDLAAGTPNVGMVDARTYSVLGPGVTKDAPLQPQAGTFAVAPEIWTRYWILLEQNAGTWERVSLWAADEARGPVQIINRVQIENNGLSDLFRFEYNTSTDAVKPGRPPLVNYVRNFVVLIDTPNPASLMLRPLAGTPPAGSGPPPSGSVPSVPGNLRITTGL